MSENVTTYLASLARANKKGGGDITEDEIRKLADFFLQLESNIPLSQLGFYFLDYGTRGYKLISRTLSLTLGYPGDTLLHEGLDFVLNVYHPNDFETVNKTVFPHTIDFLTHTPPAEGEEYVFVYTYRLRHQKGHYVTILQRCKFVFSHETRTLLYSYGIVQDISAISNTGKMYYGIDRISGRHGSTSARVYEQYLYPDQASWGVSPREREVLKLMAQGLPSKQIAAQLGIQKLTVDNHRRNMMQRTGTNNASQLINYARDRGMI